MTSSADRPAITWGRIDSNGTVYVTTGAGERVIGSWQAGDEEAGLKHFTRRYEDLVTEIELLEQRLASGAGEPKSTAQHARELRATIPDARMIGDLDGLDRRLGALIEAAEGKIQEASAKKAARRAEAIAAKEALVAEAEALAAKDSHWKASGERFKTIVEEWRTIKGIDRRTDEALWKRFRSAREQFSRHRGAHFAALDDQRGEARARKEQLVTEAEKLSDSTDWGPTSARLKALMREWKAAGRAPKAADDALWTRFRAAQDAFFARRSEVLDARDAEQRENQRRKEELIAEAEALDPGRDLAGAQNALRGIQDRFDAVGHVPREAIRPLDARMRAAEQRIRDAADVRRTKRAAASNPLLDQMREAVQKAESTLAKARAADDARRIAEAEEALQARREWLAEAERSTSG